jgi:hypothetical protein
VIHRTGEEANVSSSGHPAYSGQQASSEDSRNKGLGLTMVMVGFASCKIFAVFFVLFIKL